MTRDRFLVILRYLHFSDNSKMPARGQPGFDKLYKVRPLLDALKTRFKQQYSPHYIQAVDEAMIAYKGRNLSKAIYTNETHQKRNKSLRSSELSVWMHV